MISGISFTSNATHQMHENTQPKSSSLFGRISLNWDKIILFFNSALILAGIAFSFFIKLPLISLGLGVYGVLYVSLYGLAKRAQPASGELLRVQKEKDTALQALGLAKEQNKTLEATLQELRTKEEEQGTLEERSEAVAKQKGKLTTEVKRLSAERTTLFSAVKKLREEKGKMSKRYNDYKQAIEKMFQEAKKDPQKKALVREMLQKVKEAE